MKKVIRFSVVALAVLAGITGVQASESSSAEEVVVQETNVIYCGHIQLEMRGNERQDFTLKKDALATFKAQKLRVGGMYLSDVLRGKLLFEFAKGSRDSGGIGVSDIVLDAFVAYHVNHALSIKAGVVKTPLGMSYTMASWNLDVADRTFDKALALERSIGLMLSGRGIGRFENVRKKYQTTHGLEVGHERPLVGFGYDFMVANQAGRSGAVVLATPGSGNAYVGRLMYDWYEGFHVEASYGVSQEAGGIGSEDYQVFNIGVDIQDNVRNVKLEMYQAKNLQGLADWDESTYAVAGTQYVMDTVELAFKHVQGASKKAAKTTKLGNTFMGINYYIESKNHKMSRMTNRKRNTHRLVLNYVYASGDKETWEGLNGYHDNTWVVQYQRKF